MTESNRPLLRAKAAADYLGITERHLRSLTERRLIAFHKIGGLNMFDPADLDLYIEASRVDPVCPGRAEP